MYVLYGQSLTEKHVSASEKREILMAGLKAVALNIEACDGEGAARPFLEAWSDPGHTSEVARTLEHVAATHPHLHACPT